MIEDPELLRRYAEEKSEAAFAELVRRHVNFVYACALRRVGGDAHLAQDVAQHVFTKLARDAAKLAGRPVLGGWLFTTARNAAAQIVRTERRRQTREQEAEAMNELHPTDAADADWQRLRPVLDGTLDELDERDREAVLLRFFEGRSFAEVGGKLRLTENAARMRVDRALDRMQALLARRGVTSTAAALGLALANQAGVAAPAGLAAGVTGAALTGAGAGGMAGIFAFMSTTKFMAATAMVIALCAVGVAFHQARIVREMEGSVTAIRAERDALRTRGLTAPKELVVQRPGAAMGNSAASTQPAVPAKISLGEIDYVLDSPEGRAAYLTRATLALKTRFERFFRTAGLTGEQQDRFLQLMMSDTEALLDGLEMRRDAGAFDPAGSGMEPAATERVSAFQKQREDEVVAGLRELLGEKFKPAMQNFYTVYERNVADKLAGRLYDTESPLTAEQADQLVELLAQNHFIPKTDTMGGVSLPGELTTRRQIQPLAQAMPWMLDALVSDSAIAHASGVLLPAQVAALRVLQAQQVADLQVLPPTRVKDAGQKAK